ncbi:hypothetical protein Syun_026950 [Stephania yunnanensis]|uniref:MORN repeat-containing protein n=1 Tax=Stephania yunnanensis TaxID=152371 RepID=A0AAP0HMA4_9MAGN
MGCDMAGSKLASSCYDARCGKGRTTLLSTTCEGTNSRSGPQIPPSNKLFVGLPRLGFTSCAPCKVQPYGCGVGFLSFKAFHISWLPKLCSVQGSAISSNLKALNWILQPLCMSAPVGLTDTVEPTFSCPGRTISLDIFAYTEKELTNGQASLSSSDIVGFIVGELLLPNGDLYSGSLLGNMPESSGKYIWSDGCIYEGEWRRGMRHGHGKTQWPSGAVYEGEFSGGYIHGTDAYRRLL